MSVNLLIKQFQLPGLCMPSSHIGFQPCCDILLILVIIQIAVKEHMADVLTCEHHGITTRIVINSLTIYVRIIQTFINIFPDVVCGFCDNGFIPAPVALRKRIACVSYADGIHCDSPENG